MSVNERINPSNLLGAMVVLAAAAAACSSTSPTGPATSGPTTTVSGITLNATSVAAGVTMPATVTLTAAAPPGGLTLTLASSNPAIATVQTPVSVAGGASTVSILITAVAQGSATITATLNGSSTQSPPLTVTAGAVLSSLSLSTSTVVGGNPVTGLLTLTAPAPASGAAVSLSASDPVTVPPSVTVPAGSSSVQFTVMTRAVGGTFSTTINAAYGGTSMSVVLSVTPPTQATAHFGVTGPTETETCTLTNHGNTLDCTFNGSTSTAPGTITAWDWSYGVAATFTQTTSGPVLTMPTVDCSLVPPPPFPAGVTWFALTVKLKVHDNLGNASAEAVDSGVRLFPQGVCGF
jgi:hypothetical protein